MINQRFQKGGNMKTHKIPGNTPRRIIYRATILFALMSLMTFTSTHLRADTQTTGSCGGVNVSIPFTDVAGNNIFFCSIAAAYFSGLTSGTTATTFSPGDFVTREQMAAFITRTLDQSLERGSRRAALNQFSTPKGPNDLRLTTVGSIPVAVVSDGADLWVVNRIPGTVSRIRASDGKLLATWTGMSSGTANAIVVAAGRIFIVAETTPGTLYRIDPDGAPGPVTVVSNNLGASSNTIAFDGSRLWTANAGGGGFPTSVSRVDISTGSVTTFFIGFSRLGGILYDGANIWVSDADDDSIKKLDANGNVIQRVDAGDFPIGPFFDGMNIWVSNPLTNSLTVIRAATGTVLTTLTGNGLFTPAAGAFDGERVLVVNLEGDSVSLWKATDLTPLGAVSTGGNTDPNGVCSDGLNFWITLRISGKLARF
jgi:hypothetical protein